MSSLEIKYIKGYNNKYYITKEGKIFIANYRNTNKPKEMKQRIIAGYYSVGLESPNSTKDNRIQKIHKIHRLLAEYYIPNPLNKPCVNHKDGDKLNNNISNLEWCSIKENIIHAYKNKLNRNWWTKELGLICIDLIENYNYNFADVAKLFKLPSRTYVYHFWNIGYKTFNLKHKNIYIPKHSKKIDISLKYKEYIINLITTNTVLNIPLKKNISVTSSR